MNGTWLDNTAIPADRTVGEVLMNCVKEQMLMLAILKKRLQTQLTNTDQGKAILYKSILDTVGRNKMGIAPLKPFLKIDAVKNKDLEALLIEMEPIGGIMGAA
jgi:predicted metalloendopeptidase